MSETPIPAPPAHLGTGGRRYWREVLEEWELDVEKLAILENACACLDRIAQCRNRLRREGMTVKSARDGRPVAHPLLSVERQAQRLHAQLVAALALKDEPERPTTPSGATRGRPRERYARAR